VPRSERLDPSLTEQGDLMLRTPAVVLSEIWQETQTCKVPDCLACRAGRAMAWVAKGRTDAQTGLDVLEGIVALLERDPKYGPRQNEALAFVAMKELGFALDQIEYWATTLAYSMGMAPKDGDARGVRLSRTEGDDVVAEVLVQERTN
jgi:hypothetical protein